MAKYYRRKELHRRLVDLVGDARNDLQKIYDAGDQVEAMREKKAQRFELLQSRVREELRSAGRDGNHWLTTDLNNARLLPMSLYDGFMPAFRKLLENCADDIECFYEGAMQVSELEKDERNERLAELAGS
jgi:predicted aminopeptidase